MVRARGVEPPRGCPHMDLNHARLPFRHARIVKALFSASRYDTRLARKRKRAFGIFAKLRAPHTAFPVQRGLSPACYTFLTRKYSGKTPLKHTRNEASCQVH